MITNVLLSVLTVIITNVTDNFPKSNTYEWSTNFYTYPIYTYSEPTRTYDIIQQTIYSFSYAGETHTFTKDLLLYKRVVRLIEKKEYVESPYYEYDPTIALTNICATNALTELCITNYINAITNYIPWIKSSDEKE